MLTYKYNESLPSRPIKFYSHALLLDLYHKSCNISFMNNNNLTLHGANPENLYKAFNLSMLGKIIDFSTNTNILSWPENININLESLASHYPDPECLNLRKIISSRENININNILFTNGINEAIFLLARVLTGNTAILEPCYSEYKRAFVNSHEIFTLNDINNYDNIILANPNNPTGIYINNLHEIIKFYSDKFFIIDEAYIDFILDDNIIHDKLCGLENAVILRSLTKIFHLSGVRIGYIIANESIIERVKKFQPTWSVNSIAQELAVKFLNDSNFYEQTRKFYKYHTPEFMKNLRLAGFDVINSDVHYFLIRVNNDMEALRILLKNGMTARHTRNFAGLNGQYLRVATRFENENKFFIETLKSLSS